MAVHYRTQGFILKKIDKGEADQLFTIYTKEFGKIEILGKAIRKIKSKLRPGTDNFYLSEVEFIQGKIYKTLTDAVLIDKFGYLRKDLRKLKIVYQISDIFDGLVRGQEKDDKTWNLLLGTFKELNNQPSARTDPVQDKQSTINHKNAWPSLGDGTSNQQLIYYYFFWKFLSLLGYKPELHTCSLCQKKLIPQNLYFNFREGGVICQNCFKKTKEGERIFPETIKILRFILEKKWQIVSRLKTEEKYFQSLKKISDYWINFLPKTTSNF